MRERTETGSDLAHARAKFSCRHLGIEERAPDDVAQEPHARNGAGRVEFQLLVVEFRCERLEFLRRSCDPVLETRLGQREPAADQCRKTLPPLHRGFSRREFTDLADHVSVALAGQSLDEIPPTPKSSYPERRDGETTQEEWQRKGRQKLSRRDREPKRDCRKAEGVPRLATEISKALRGFVDSSCIHVD